MHSYYHTTDFQVNFSSSVLAHMRKSRKYTMIFLRSSNSVLLFIHTSMYEKCSHDRTILKSGSFEDDEKHKQKCLVYRSGINRRILLFFELCSPVHT